MLILGELQGTKETLENPLISLLDKGRFELSPRAMNMLGLVEKSRVNFSKDENGNMFISPTDDERIKTSLSKHGKTQHPGIHSYLVDTPFGEDTKWIITEETIEFGGATWNKIEIFNKPEELEPVPSAPVPAECTNNCETPCAEHGGGEPEVNQEVSEGSGRDVEGDMEANTAPEQAAEDAPFESQAVETEVKEPVAEETPAAPMESAPATEEESTEDAF